MKNKLKLTLVVFFASAFSLLFSQDINVSGNVNDTSGVPLPGVNIQVKGTSKGTSTDFDGKYKITASQGDVLVFSFLGFKTKEVTVRNTLENVVLEESSDKLDEVVITAFGIPQKEKSLGYAVSQVKTENLSITGSNNAFTALQGEVSGLRITKTSGSVGGGIDILIRGMSSMDPNSSNTPLIVVDGVPINNDSFSPSLLGSSENSWILSSEKYSATSRSADLNPDDIENFNILKGAAATALYGNRANNGAIIITTKKGKQGKPKISLSSSITTNRVRKTPELQSVFREGRFGRPYRLYTPETEDGYTLTGVGSGNGPYTWGVRYADDNFEYNGTTVDLTNDNYYNPYSMFDTGYFYNTNASLSGATDKFNYFMSVANAKEDGIIPNTDYKRTNFRVNSSYNATETFTVNTSFALTSSDSRKPTGGDKSIMSALGYWTPTFPISDYLNPDGSRRNPYPGFVDNPLYNAEFSSLTEDTDRWLAKANLEWAPINWFNINYTLQYDNYTSQFHRFVAPDLDEGSGENGFIVNQDVVFKGVESNLLLTFNKEFSQEINASLLLGNQVTDNSWESNRQYGENLLFPHDTHISNATENFRVSNDLTRDRTIGVFGELKVNLYDQLFISVTGRNDWLSKMPENKSVFYPSVSVAYDLRKGLFDYSKTISFAKLRVSYAEVGSPIPLTVTNKLNRASGFPWGGTSGYEYQDVKIDPDIVPQLSKGWEVGFDLRFLNNRLRLDYSYFKTKVTNSIFPVATPSSTGYTQFWRNAGEYTTYGHEVALNGDIVKNEDFTFSVNYTFDTSDGKVTHLPSDVPYIDFLSPDPDPSGARLYLQPRVGDKIGTIYGYVSNRTEDGQLIIGSDGLPTTDFDNLVKVGDATPDFTMGFGNTFKWRDLRFNFLFEWKKGGDKFTWTRYVTNRFGSSQYTMQFRENDTYVFNGVMEDPTNPGSYIANTTEVDTSPTSSSLYNFFNGGTGWRRNAEVLLQDASWVKLRNVSLSYLLNSSKIGLNFIDSIQFEASVNNILIWTPFDGYDPEGTDYGPGRPGLAAFTGRTIPLTENYTFGVTFNF
ncbi:MAG: SusC/RagA family TonB-linked outer membrane protein [Flavobacteriaceae bacterium]